VAKAVNEVASGKDPSDAASEAADAISNAAESVQ
jgi:hypothetical protein